MLQLSSVIILHVDDLLIAADAGDMEKFDRVVTQFKTGAREIIDVNNPVEYLGIEIVCDNDGNPPKLSSLAQNVIALKIYTSWPPGFPAV